MWSRVSIKTYAKDFLRKHYWKAFLVCLIVAIVGNTGITANSQVERYRDYNQDYIVNEENHDIALRVKNSSFNFWAKHIIGESIFYVARDIFITIVIVLVILYITIGLVLNVGKSRFFLKGFEGDVCIKYLFSTFNLKEYFSILKTMFVSVLYILLWSLLLIVPGIVKSYEYRMVPYILAEDPNLSTSEALKRSSIMTDGHKWDIFVLDWSFIGWDILGMILFGIGGIFVTPYKEATSARLYNILDGKDLDNSIEI